jgi:D-serine deaminase-like pyridoxal phosphate-dependent protein
MGSVPGPKGDDDPTQHEAKTKANLQIVLDSKDAMEQAGLSIEVVSVGGTHCYAQAIGMPGITEVRAGRYPLMDHRLKSFLPELNPAAKILTSVISHPIDGMAVLDAGHKSTAPDQGRPVLEGIEGGNATRFSAEHGIVELEGEAQNKLKAGDKAWLIPYELGGTVNQYDYFRAAKNGKLEGFWPISARGRLA